MIQHKDVNIQLRSVSVINAYYETDRFRILANFSLSITRTRIDRTEGNQE